MRTAIGTIALALVLSLCGVVLAAGQTVRTTNTRVEVTKLLTEYRSDPLGIDAPAPRLSWILRSSRRGERQSAYQVLVASTPQLLDANRGDLWNTGKVVSDRQTQVEYAGRRLASRATCFWKVRAWDRRGRASRWSAPARWTMGLLNKSDWTGDWIGSDPSDKERAAFLHAPILVRKELDLVKPVTRATVFFCGLGWSELNINGNRVGDYVMGPGFTTYDKRVQYLSFDVTGLIPKAGHLTLDATLFDGWYALERDPWVHQFEKRPYVDRPKLLLDLRLEHPDGSVTIVKSDETWKWSLGPIRRAWICEQDSDLRITAGPWRPVVVVNGPAGRLVAQKEPPTRVVELVHPASVTESKGTWTYTFDHEFTGHVRFKASGTAGTKVELTTHPAKLWPRHFSFILSGRSSDIFEPRETYTAIVKVSIQGLTKAPALNDLTGCRITGVGADVSSFECSNPDINWLHECVRRTQTNYVTFLPNDPTREFKGWTQDIQSMFWSAMWLFDSRAMYERWQSDILDNQTADGHLPCVSPGPVFDDYNSPWWGGCAVWLPWEMYERTGDSRLLRDSYQGMRRYVDYLSQHATNGVQDWGLTDWLAWESTPRPIVNTPAWYLYARIVSRTAGMLGRQDDEAKYARLANEIRDRFNTLYLNRSTGIYGIPGVKPEVEGSGRNNYPPLTHKIWWTGDRTCTQTGQALPLALGMVPKECRPATEQALLREIAAHGDHVSAGFVGTPYLLQLLTDLSPEQGYAMTTQRDFPSWFAMTRGAGCDQMMETWNGGQAFMPSLGGNIAAWDIEALAGIRPDPSGPGFRKAIIKPALIGGLSWAKSTYQSPYGAISIHWQRAGSRFTLDLTIPPGTTATVFMPSAATSPVMEGGKPATRAEGVRFLRRTLQVDVFEIASGTYRFRSRI